MLTVGKDLARDYATFAEAMRSVDADPILVAHPRNLEGVDLPRERRSCAAASPSPSSATSTPAACVVVPQRRDDYVYGSEGGGLTAVLEAMAMGRPVVASERPMLHDYVDDGVDALLVPAGGSGSVARCGRAGPRRPRARAVTRCGRPRARRARPHVARLRRGARTRSPVSRLGSPRMSTYLDVVRYRELLGNLFRRDLQAKYRGSALGVLWTVANPVMLMGVYLLVFGVVWKSPFAQGGHYPLFLLTGLALWTFFAAAVQSSTRSMLDNANLIRKTRFPRQLVPLSVVFAHLVSFAAMLVLLLVDQLHRVAARARDRVARDSAVRAVRRRRVRFALAVASLNVLFRDVEFMVAALLVPWFFLTPILYPLDRLGARQASHDRRSSSTGRIRSSPAIEAVRAPLFAGTLPFWGDALYLVVACGVALVLGAFVFRRVDDQIAIEV